MKKKPKYRIRNWREYDTSLKRRGSLTFWISEDLLKNWILEEKTGERGASRFYSDAAIEVMAGLKFLFQLAGRQTEGLVCSIFEMLKVELSVPDHSTLSRRLSSLDIRLDVKKAEGSRHVVADSTGLKVYGEGEWKVRQHGVSKRRTWRKLHLCVDESTGEILAVGASENSVSDGQMLPSLLDEVEGEISEVSADGIYDHKKVYDAINKHKARASIPPRVNAKIWKHGNSKSERLVRDENLRFIRKHGRKKWKRESNYHRRSLAETAMFRFKITFSDKLQSRKIDNQFNEMFLKCSLLNRMTHLGTPDSYKVQA